MNENTKKTVVIGLIVAAGAGALWYLARSGMSVSPNPVDQGQGYALNVPGAGSDGGQMYVPSTFNLDSPVGSAPGPGSSTYLNFVGPTSNIGGNTFNMGGGDCGCCQPTCSSSANWTGGGTATVPAFGSPYDLASAALATGLGDFLGNTLTNLYNNQVNSPWAVATYGGSNGVETELNMQRANASQMRAAANDVMSSGNFVPMLGAVDYHTL